MPARVSKEEILRIFELQEILDYCDLIKQGLRQYLRLGWRLAVLNAAAQIFPHIDLQASEEVWGRQLQDLALEKGVLGLGVYTGTPSRLIVLELPAERHDFPDYLAEMESQTCIAEIAQGRRLYFYALTDDWSPPSSFLILSFEIMVHGEGGLVLLPPSHDPNTQVSRRWLKPPWEIPPAPLARGLKDYLRLISPDRKSTLSATGPNIIPWRALYPAIAPYPEIMAALFTPAPSSPAYYRHLLHVAQAVGLQDVHILLGLLWYAPLGNARQHPQGGEFLLDLIRFMLLSREKKSLDPDLQPSPALSLPGTQEEDSQPRMPS